MPELPQRPYLLRAMLDWIVDNGWTPHLIVDARPDRVIVPRQFVTEGYIRLNVSASATQSFRIGPDAVEFNARFGGVSHHIHVPLENVLAIVARENGKGMAFAAEAEAAPSGDGSTAAGEGRGDDDAGNAAPGNAEPGKDEPPPRPPAGPGKPRTRPSLKVVK